MDLGLQHLSLSARPWVAPGEAVQLEPPVAGYAAWWDSEQGALTDVDGVYQWDDQVSSYSLLQATGALKPDEATVNGTTIIRFDGIDDYLSMNNTFIDSGDNWTAFITCRFPASAEVPFHWSDNTVNDNRGTRIYSHTASGSVLARSGGNKIQNYDHPTYPYTELWTWKFALNDKLYLWIDGTAQDTPVAVTTMDNTLDSLNIGDMDATPTNPFSGDIRDIVLYTSALSDADRQSVESWMTARMPW